MIAVCGDILEISICGSESASLLWVVSIYCSEAVKERLTLLMEGANSAAVPTTVLPPSQCILATMTLLPHYLRQPVAKLPSSITLFITQMVDTSLDYWGQRHFT